MTRDARPDPRQAERLRQEVSAAIEANPDVLRQFQESEDYLARGGVGIPWDEVVRKARVRRGKPAV